MGQNIKLQLSHPESEYWNQYEGKTFSTVIWSIMIRRLFRNFWYLCRLSTCSRTGASLPLSHHQGKFYESQRLSKIIYLWRLSNIRIAISFQVDQEKSHITFEKGEISENFVLAHLQLYIALKIVKLPRDLELTLFSFTLI